MKIYVDKVEKRNVKNNRRRMSNYNNTFLPCGGVYPRKVKWPAESKFCNKCKNILSSSIAKQN